MHFFETRGFLKKSIDVRMKFRKIRKKYAVHSVFNQINFTAYGLHKDDLSAIFSFGYFSLKITFRC